MIVTMHYDLDSVPVETSRIRAELTEGVVVEAFGKRATVKIGDQSFEFSTPDADGLVTVSRNGTEIAKAPAT